MLSHLGIAFMRALAWLPLRWTRTLGWLFGWALYLLVAPRRRIVRSNLLLCFPELETSTRQGLEAKIFINFAQAWLDRGWLWHARRETVAKRLKLTGAVHEFDGSSPIVIFAPHFMGMDAGGIALMLNLPRQYTSIYTDQSNQVVDAWMLRGRQRFGVMRMFNRSDGVREIANSLKQGQPLYLLPDMDFGDKGAEFVPFFGVTAATVPSLSRFARLGGAKVVPVITRLTQTGYEVQVMPAWQNFPTADMRADTLRMNQELEGYIRSMPDQYYWVHKRFKTRPPNEPSVY
ncbi:MAG: lipid A biosynthesis acyltransferase [Burkholderiaceae bacterium]